MKIHRNFPILHTRVKHAFMKSISSINDLKTQSANALRGIEMPRNLFRFASKHISSLKIINPNNLNSSCLLPSPTLKTPRAKSHGFTAHAAQKIPSWFQGLFFNFKHKATSLGIINYEVLTIISSRIPKKHIRVLWRQHVIHPPYKQFIWCKFVIAKLSSKQTPAKRVVTGYAENSFLFQFASTQQDMPRRN